VVGKLEGIDKKTRELIREESSDRMIAELSTAAEKVDPGTSTVLALDWMNGRRTPDANQNLKGAIMGLTLGTDAPAIFRALIEATAYGARSIVDRFVEEGVRIDGVIALGGVAKKSPLVMQIVADVLNKPIKVASSDQAVALGSAMAAAVVAGVHPSIPEAQEAMGGGFETEYRPDPAKVNIYDTLYRQYIRFGGFVEGETERTPANK
jgi:L-ribulokinase